MDQKEANGETGWKISREGITSVHMALVSLKGLKNLKKSDVSMGRWKARG